VTVVFTGAENPHF